MSEPDDPKRTTRPSVYAPADDEDTDRIAGAVLARLASGSDPDPPAGLIVDRYINAELRALGGMGRVFVAYDPVLERTVALKALPVGLSPHEPAAAVSRREGQALAGIDHPNVVRVYEMVEHRGLECLVLEHVSGVDLGVWLRSAPRDWRDVLVKFLGAGEGLAAVHRAGLVHRDFKPANVLVGDHGAVKLVDFGLAVQAGALAPGDPEICAGTPRFMAPEQIQGREVSAASDQYSYCVALYEALFGLHPYLPPDLEPGPRPAITLSSRAELESRRAVFGAILRGALRRPKALPPGLPAGVLPCLLRGLAAEPARRFASMEALLAELRHDPRRARRRWFLGLGVCATLSLLSYQLGRREECVSPDDLARQVWSGREAVIAQRLERFGEKPLERLRRAIRGLADARHARCEASARGGREDFATERAICLYSQQEALFRVLSQLERGSDTAVTNLVGRFDELPSARDCDDPVRLRYHCAARPPEALASSKVALLAGRYADAEAWARAALDEALTGGAIGPAVEARIVLGRIEQDQERPASARVELLRARDVAERNGCLTLAGESYHWLTKAAAFDPSVPLALAEEWSALHQLRVSPNDVSGRADVLNNRALIAERRATDLPRAAALLNDAIASRSDDFDATAAQADSYLNLGSVLLDQGELDAAEAALRAAQARRQAILGPAHPQNHKELRNLGNLELKRGRPAEALALYRTALALVTAGMGPQSPVAGHLHVALAQAHDRLGDTQAAFAEASAAADIYANLPVHDPRRDAGVQAVAQTLIAAERHEDALPWLARAEAYLAAQPEAPPERRGFLEFRWADALNGVKRHAEAERRARSAGVWFDRAGLAANDPLRAHAALYLAEALLGQDRWREAVAPFERAAAIWRARGDNPELLAYAVSGLARSLCRIPGRRGEARDVLRTMPLIDFPASGHLASEAAALCGLR